MISLLDTSVLIALLDSAHTHHKFVLQWFASASVNGWATCPIVENGALRILCGAAYPNRVLSIHQGVNSLRELVRQPRHSFWADDISLLTTELVEMARIRSVHQLTDIYLLALASTHGGVLATLDKRLETSTIAQGLSHLVVIPT